MQKLLLIDGNSILNRAYFAIPALNDKQGQNVNAVYGFVNILLKVLDDHKPDKQYENTDERCALLGFFDRVDREGECCERQNDADKE